MTPPAKFESHWKVESNEAYLKLLETEGFISYFLNSAYELIDRVESATKALNSESRNVIWPDITKTNAKLKRPVLVNLAKTYEIASPMHSQSSRHVLDMIDARGKRAHRVHLEAFIEGDPLEIVFSDENPYSSYEPTLRFSETDRARWATSLTEFLNWWTSQTDTQLRSP